MRGGSTRPWSTCSDRTSVGNQLGSSTALIRIPAFGDDYEVPMVEGVRDSDLSEGIGHFPGTGPGQVGNFALAAHRITHGEPFRDMPTCGRATRSIVETADATYTYVLDTDPNDLNVPFTQNWVLDPVPVATRGPGRAAGHADVRDRPPRPRRSSR